MSVNGGPGPVSREAVGGPSGERWLRMRASAAVVMAVAAAAVVAGAVPRQPSYVLGPPPGHEVGLADVAKPSILVGGAGGRAWIVDRMGGEIVVVGRGGMVERTVPLPLGREELAFPRPLMVAPWGDGGAWLWDVAGERGFVWYDDDWHGPYGLAGRVAGLAAFDDGGAVLNLPADPAGSFAVLGRDGAVRARFGAAPTPPHPQLARYYDSWVVMTAGDDVVAAARYLPRLVRYRRDGTAVWERVLRASGLAALDASRLRRIDALKEDCASGCVDVELVEFASMGQGFADGTVVVDFSRRGRLDWFAEDGSWQAASRLIAPAPVVLGDVGLAVLGDEVLLGLDGRLALLGAGPTESGRVVDGDAAPVQGARVAVTVADEPEHVCTTGPDGTFLVPGRLVGDTGLVSVQADGYLPLRRTGELGELLRRDLVLEAEPVVCVRVVDRSTRDPVQRFTIRVGHKVLGSGRATVEQGEAPTAVDSPDGHACLSAAWSPPLEIRVCADGHACASRRVLEVGESVVELGPEARLRVVVAEDGGVPVDGAAVTLNTPENARRRPRLEDEYRTTDEEGSALFTGLEPGPYQLEVSDGGHLPHREMVGLDEGSNRRRVTVERGVTAVVHVTEDGGEPVPGATVWVMSREPAADGRTGGSCDTGEDGRCEVGGLPPGEARALASTGDGRQVARSFTAAGERTPVELDLDGSCRVEGDVVGGEEFPDTRLSVTAAQSGYAATVTVSATGSFAFEGLPEGRTLFRVEGSGGGRAGGVELAAETRVVEEDMDRVELHLRPPVHVQGTVRVGGRPCGACDLAFTPADDPSRGTVHAATASGWYEVRLPRAGSYAVTIADGDGGRRFFRECTVTGDDTWDVDLDDGAVVGTVVLADTQEGVAGATVRVADEGGRLLDDTVTDDTGAFRFDGLAAGPVRVAAESGGAAAERTVEVVAGVARVVLEIDGRDALVLRLADGRTGRRVTGTVIGSVMAPSGASWPFARDVLPGEDLRLPAPENGPYTVVVRVDPYARTTVRVTPGNDGTVVPLWLPAVVEAELPGGGEATLELRDTAGSPVAVSGTYPYVRLVGSGLLAAAVPPGSYLLSVVDLGTGRLFQRAVSLSEGERSSVRVVWP